MLKLIYLAKRKPGYTFDQFVCRWRQHGALAMSQPLWRFALGYVQAEPIKPPAVAGASEEYDAVACYMVQDDMFSNMDEQDIAGAMAMAQDELETFSAPIPSTSVWVNEEQIRAGELGGITAFLFFRSATAARTAAEQANHSANLHRIILNLRNNSVLGPDMNSLPFEAVVELSACNISNLVAVLESEVDDLLLSCDVVVVTREAVLWDRKLSNLEAM